LLSDEGGSSFLLSFCWQSAKDLGSVMRTGLSCLCLVMVKAAFFGGSVNLMGSSSAVNSAIMKV
jgi:hypothetical protein